MTSRPKPSDSAFVAALRQRCPKCRDGPIFSGRVRMNEFCPRCGLRFEREPGYFLGAMYFSYVLAIPILGLLILGVFLSCFAVATSEVQPRTELRIVAGSFELSVTSEP